MEKTPQQLLEDVIHRELSKLPEQQAPSTLVPRVLARIQAREQRRWWMRPWTQWPPVLQVALFPMLIGGVAGAVYCLWQGWQALIGAIELDALPEAFGNLSMVWDIVTTLGNALLLLARAAGTEWLLLATLIPMGMYCACLGLGTLCYRTAVQRRSV